MTAYVPLIGGAAPMFSRRSMALCATGGKLVFFGGVGAAGTESILDVANDCWLFDPRTLAWQPVPQCGEWPSRRRCVGVAPTSSGMFLWGGSGLSDTATGPRHTFLNDWWHFDLARGRWSMIRGSDDHLRSPEPGMAPDYPIPRYTPVFHAAAGRVVLFGGYTEDRLGKRKLNDAWIAEGQTWRQVPEQGAPGYDAKATWPGPRYGCMSAASDQDVFVCGGFSDAGDHNDLWRFDARRASWDLLAPASAGPETPAPRYCAAFAYHHHRLFLFGGRSRSNAKRNFNDLWVFDLATGTWQMVHPSRMPHEYGAAAPFPAYHAKASSAVEGDHWYLWGGEGLSGHVSDFWRFSFEDGTWTLLQAARQDDPHFW